jgi:hypothetical protein
MSFSGTVPNEYQLPVDVLSALKHRQVRGPGSSATFKAPALQLKPLLGSSLLSKSHQNLHAIGKNDDFIDTSERTSVKSTSHGASTDRVTGGRLERHRSSMSQTELLKSSTTHFNPNISLRKSTGETSVSSSQTSSW